MITALLSKRAFENPAVPLGDPDDFTIAAFGGGISRSGVAVNASSVLQHSPIWRGVNLIARDVAKLPCLVFKRVGAGLERDKNHPAFRLLRWKANSEMTAFQFFQTMQLQAVLRGNSYSHIFRKGNTDPSELVPLNPNDTFPVRENGMLLYVTKVNGENVKVAPRNIIHIKGIGDGILGFEMVNKGRDSIGASMGATRHGATFFRNNARHGVLLMHPKSMRAEKIVELKEQWDNMHKGIDNAHKTVILQDGMKVQNIGMTNEEAQFLETLRWGIIEASNWLNIPPHKLGADTRTSFSSLEQENQSYLDGGLDPWLVNWEAELRDKLLSENQKMADSHVIEFVRQALMRAAAKDRAEFYNKALMGGWMSRDEVRSRENMNPIPDGEGEKFMVALNMVTVGAATDANSARSHANQELLREVVGRMVRRLCGVCKRLAKKPAEDYLNGLKALNDETPAIAGSLRRAFAVSAPGASPEAGAAAIIGEVRSWLTEASNEPIETRESTINAISDTLTNGSLDEIVAVATKNHQEERGDDEEKDS